ncbi:MAG: acyl-CoA dehydrogenase family protein [Pseudomonadota bacterium]
MFFSEAAWATDELRDFAQGVGNFLDREIIPYREEFEKAGALSKEVWRQAGDNGLLGVCVPEEYGGLGATLAYESVLLAEMGLRNEMGFGYYVHSVVVHYILAYGTSEQKARWLPRLSSGELIGAICMSEPGAGSDLQAIKTRAELDGDGYCVNGSKTFISNGQIANFLLVVAKTDKSLGAKGISLIVIETDDVEGFRRGKNLEKLGLKSQDTSELLFDDVRVPTANGGGEHPGAGFGKYLVNN